MDPRDLELIEHAALLLEQQGHRQTATALRTATALAHPALGTRFKGRWQLWIDPAAPLTEPFHVAQQIKRALNTISGEDASYADLHTCRT